MKKNEQTLPGLLISFEEHSDPRGVLIALEQNKNIPFEIKRVYLMKGMGSNSPRGFHAHKNLNQIAICISGACDFVLDDGVQKTAYHLDTASKGLLIGSMTWREMHNFSEDCIVVVLADQLYDESDYIREYDAFLKAVAAGRRI